MTRFARAKGSKASNERVPEKATPWGIMKEDLQRRKQENEENKAREEHDKVRQQNYDNFLKQQTSELKTEWADFSDDESGKRKEKKLKKGIEKKKKSKDNILKSGSISKKDILEMLKPDPEIDAQVNKLTSEIVKVLDKEKLKKKKNENNVKKSKKTEIIQSEENIINPNKKNQKGTQNQNMSENDNNLNIELKVKDRNISKNKNKKSKIQPVSEEIQNELYDDAPAEISSKIETPKIVLAKPKKKKALKIKLGIEKSDKQPNEKIKEVRIVKTNEKSKIEENTDNIDKPVTKDENEIEQKITKSMRKRLMKKKKKDALKREANAGNDETNLENKIVSSPKEKNMNKRKLPTENFDKPSKFQRNELTQKKAKVRDNKEHKRRKPDEGPTKIIINGLEIEIVKFEGFPIKKEDAERLTELKKQMISKGIPRSEVKRTLLLERRKSEKSLTRDKKKVCYQCRKEGHMLSDCPELNSQQVSFSGSGICFKCGSTEHSHFECKVNKTDEYKFASCFICKEQGHIARQCPDNPKGLYPHGGGCRLCGDVTHLKKDCPQTMKEKEDNTLSLKTISAGNLESLDDDINKPISKSLTTTVKNKIIKF